MKLVETTGLITREIKYGDKSRIITVITSDMGKISAIANKFKGGKGKSIPSLQLFSYSKFVLFKGSEKGLYHINEADIIEPFKNIRENLMSIIYASYFCDVANHITVENESDKEFLRLLLNVFYALNKGEDQEKIKTVFEWKTAMLEGYAPDINSCFSCGEEETAYLDMGKGCGLCEKCGKDYAQSVSVNKGIRDAINYIKDADISKILSFKASDKMIEYLNSLSEIYLKTHLDCEFKTLDYLKKMK